MNTARPEKPVPLLMALETGIVLYGNGRWRSLRKSDHPLKGFASRANMLCGRSMTAFTPKFFSSGTGVLQKQLAHSCFGEVIVDFLVAGLADFRACILFIGLSGLFVRLFCRCR
jgi:hypothetical protein